MTLPKKKPSSKSFRSLVLTGKGGPSPTGAAAPAAGATAAPATAIGSGESGASAGSGYVVRPDSFVSLFDGPVGQCPTGRTRIFLN